MPLSDDERRRLEKLQDLAAADPDLNLKLGAGSCRDAGARTVSGALTVRAGPTAVIAAIITICHRRRRRIPGTVRAHTGPDRHPAEPRTQVGPAHTLNSAKRPGAEPVSVDRLSAGQRRGTLARGRSRL